MALLAGGTVVGVGGAITFAAWVDEEWVFGGTDGNGGPGIATSAFEVQQNTSSPYDSATGWIDEEANPGGELIFGLGAISLEPGDVIYAPVALATTDISLGGTIALQDAVDADGTTPDAALWDALVLTVGGYNGATLATAPPSCDAAGFASYTTSIVDALDAQGDPLVGLSADDPVTGQTLLAERGDVWHFCFRIELPSDVSQELQGQGVAPAWQFITTSS